MAISRASTHNRLVSALAVAAVAIATAATAAPHDAGVCRGSSALTQAKAGLAEGDHQVSRRHLRQASQLFERHLEALVAHYGRLHPTTLDDTGSHLSLTHYMEDDGRLQQAVRLKREMLIDEIKVCEEDVAEPPPQASKPP